MKKNYFAMAFTVLLGIVQAGAQTWEAVGAATGVSAGSAGRMNLLTDYEGNLLLGYYDVAVTKGNVQKYSNGAWAYLDGSSTGVTSGFATYNSLSADSQGAVYFTNQDSGMQVRQFSGGAWTQLSQPATNTINFQASAVSATNVLFVASNDASGTVKRYVNGAWEQVGTTGFFGGTPSFLDMVVSSDGYVYISFNNSGYVHVYKNSITASATEAWTSVGDLNLAAASSSENYNSTIAIDGDDNLYLAYVSGSAGGNKLNVKKFSNGAWSQLGSENFTDTKIQHAAIAVSEDGDVYVGGSIWENTDYLKNYVMGYNPGTDSWSQLGTDFIAQGQATFNSLAVGTDGSVYIAFTDSGLGKISVKKFIPGETVAVTGVDVTVANNATAAITTNAGTLQLVATVLPANATNSAVTWAITSGSGFATISQNGLVTATANGTITVTVTTADGSYTDTIDVVITGQTVAVTGVEVSVADNATAAITTNAGTLQLVATVLPANATNSAVTWAITSGTGFATISQNGLVTATANGTITVTVTTADGSHTDTIDVVITGQTVAVTGVEVSVANNAAAAITTNAGTLQLVATVLPADATNSAVTWAITSGSAYATIDANGLVTAVANGTITVTVTTADGSYTDTIDVVISGQTVAVTGVEVSVADNAAATITTDAGTLQLVATVLPADATNSAVTWAITSGSAYATIDANGLVTAVANGTITVTVTTADGSYTDTIDVIISGQVVAVTAITVTVENNAEAVITTAGGTLQLVATITPEDATVTDVTWSVVSGNEYATVDANGLVTAVASGTVVVRATAADGTVYGEVTITVTIDTTGTEDFTIGVFSAYPNPTTGIVYIESASQVASIKVYDNLGREVYTTNAQSVDLSGYSSGVYILNATFNDGSLKVAKIVKE